MFIHKADLYKSPGRRPVEAIVPHESTGSSYFKQMMRGKKPVASISQYHLRKRKKHGKKGEKDGDLKRHHHHHKKDKK